MVLGHNNEEKLEDIAALNFLYSRHLLYTAMQHRVTFKRRSTTHAVAKQIDSFNEICSKCRNRFVLTSVEAEKHGSSLSEQKIEPEPEVG